MTSTEGETMNYCTKCASWYEQPGTCNCYAPQPGTFAPPIIDVTSVPMPGTTWIPCPQTTGGTIVGKGVYPPFTVTYSAAAGNRSCNLAGCNGRCGICTPPS